MRCSAVALLATLLVAPLPAAATETLARKPEYCLFVTVDGLDRDYIARGDAPTLLALQDAGTSMPDSLSVYPTLTTPNMTSLVTGSYPLTTGIGANTVYLKDEKKIVAGPRFNKADTIAEAFKKAGHPTAAVQHFMLENRGADRYNHITSADSSEITSQALVFLREQPTPKLLAVLYQTLDKKGHAYGASSTTVSQECRMLDGEIKKLLDAYRELGLLDRTVIAITADHGMSGTEKPIDRKLLNDTITKGGWSYQQLTDKVPTPNATADFLFISLGNMNCYFNRPFSTEEQLRLFAAFQSVPGVGAIYNEGALRRMKAHPNAGDFIVEPAPGYWFGGGGGVHGRMTEGDPFLTISGPGIRRRNVVQGAESVDIVPTVLQAMGIEIPRSVDGKVLWTALE